MYSEKMVLFDQKFNFISSEIIECFDVILFFEIIFILQNIVHIQLWKYQLTSERDDNDTNYKCKNLLKGLILLNNQLKNKKL